MTNQHVCECGHVLRGHKDGRCQGAWCPCNNPTRASDAQAATLRALQRNQQHEKTNTKRLLMEGF